MTLFFPRTGTLTLIDAEPYAAKRISGELQSGQQLVLKPPRRLTLRERKTNHLSVVLVNDSGSAAQIGIEVVIMPASKPRFGARKMRGSFLQVY